MAQSQGGEPKGSLSSLDPRKLWAFMGLSGQPAEGLVRYVERKMLARSIMFVPSADTLSERGQNLLQDLAVAIEGAFPETPMGRDGMPFPCIAEPARKLLSAQGVYPSPAGAQPIAASREALERFAADEDPLRREVGLTGKIPDYAMETLGMVFRAIFTEAVVPQPFSMKKRSNSGAPYFVTSVAPKLAELAGFDKDPELIAAAFQSSDWKYLTSRGLVLLYTTAYRTQLDGGEFDPKAMTFKPKVREQPDHLGRSVVNDKTMPPEHAHAPMMVAARSRPIAMAPSVLTFLRPWAKGFEAQMYKRCKPLVVRGTDDINGRISRFKYFCATDVKQMDQNILAPIMDQFLDLATAMLPPAMAQLFRDSLIAPVLAHNDYRGERGATIRGGVPWDYSTWHGDIGNPSGNPFTSVIAKLIGIKYTLDVLHHPHFGVTFDDVLLLFADAHPRYSMIAAGDNILMMFSSEEDLEVYREAINSHSPCAILEESSTILGHVLAASTAGPVAMQSLMSFPLKTFGTDKSIAPLGVIRKAAAEVKKEGFIPDGIYAKSNVFWGQGYLNRVNVVYAKDPSFGKMREIVENLVEHHTGKTMTAWATEAAEAAQPIMDELISQSEFLEASRHTASEALWRFLDDPASVDWDPRVPIDSVPPRLKDALTRTVAPDDPNFTGFWKIVNS